jgi:hypothetical protein
VLKSDNFAKIGHVVQIILHQFVPKASDEKNLSLKKIDPKMQLRFGGNWLHIIFRRIVLEVAQIWNFA